MRNLFSKEYAKYYSSIYKDKDYKQEAEWVYNWAHQPQTILELGCGLGQHAKYWAKNSQILGIDQSSYMIKNAYKHKNITYSNDDINRFLYIWAGLRYPAPASFDCVMAMFNVVGYALLEEIIPLLPLKKGGYLIFDVWNAAKFDKFPPQIKVKYFDKFYRISIPKRISKRLLQIDFIIVNESKIVALEKHFVQGYFHKDIQDLCKKYSYRIAGVKRTKTWQIWYKIMKVK